MSVDLRLAAAEYLRDRRARGYVLAEEDWLLKSFLNGLDARGPSDFDGAFAAMTKERVAALLVELGLAPSKSEAERLIKQGGAEIDGQRVEDFRKDVDLTRPTEFLLRAGKKKFLRVVVE